MAAYLVAGKKNSSGSSAGLTRIVGMPPRVYQPRIFAVNVHSTSVSVPAPHVATADNEGPNNNNNINIISGQQPTPHVATGDIEAPNNHNISGQQPAPDVATAEIEAANNNSNISGQQDINNVSNFNTGNVLAAFDIVLGIAAMVLNPPSSDEPVFDVATGVVVAAGVVRGLEQCLASRNASSGCITGVICIAAFVFGIVLDAYAYKVKK